MPVIPGRRFFGQLYPKRFQMRNEAVIFLGLEDQHVGGFAAPL
jgi:hypothetical protein